MTHSTTLYERSNYQHLVLDIGWFGIALASTSRFMQFYAIRMGADAVALNLMTALPALVLIFSTILSAWWRRRYSDSVHALMLPSLGYRLIFLLPAFAPFFPLEWRVLWLILSAAVPAMSQGMSNVIFVVMMRETVSHERIPSLLARRQFALNIMVLVGVFIFGFLLENLPFPLNYQVMFVIAFIFAMMSQWHLTRLHPLVPPHKPKRAKQGDLTRLMKTDTFQSVALMTVLSFAAYFSIFAVIPLFLEQKFGADEGYIALYSMMELIAGAAITLVIGRLLARLGSRTVIAGSLVVTGIAAIIIALAPSLEFALAGAVLTGMGWNANNVAILRFFTERTAANDMSASTAFHEIMFLSMFVGPMLGTLIAATGVSLLHIVLLGAILRLVAAIVAHFGLRLFGKAKVVPVTA